MRRIATLPTNLPRCAASTARRYSFDIHAMAFREMRSLRGLGRCGVTVNCCPSQTMKRRYR